MLESIKKGSGVTVGVLLGCTAFGALATLVKVEAEGDKKNEKPEEEVEKP